MYNKLTLHVVVSGTCQVVVSSVSSSLYFLHSLQLLDDNQELYIPETQEMVQAHPKFMLFATQNPPGLYGGRKVILFNAYQQVFVCVLVCQKSGTAVC